LDELVRRILDRLDGLYMVDLLCDKQLIPFYERLGMHGATGAMLRNHEYQAGPRVPVEPDQQLNERI